MARFIMSNFQKGLLNFFEESASYLKKLSSFEVSSSCTPLISEELVGCSKESTFDIKGTSLAGWKQTVTTGLAYEMVLRSEAWGSQFEEISTLKSGLHPLNAIFVQMLPEYKFILQLQAKSISLVDECDTFLKIHTNSRFNFHSALTNLDFFKNHILPSMVERDLFIYSWLRLEFSADVPLSDECSFICDKHSRTWIEFFYSFFTNNYSGYLENEIITHTSGIPQMTRDVIFDVSASSSRSWVGFFYDILNPGYWFGTKPVPTINIDPNVTGPSLVIPVKSTRTWGSFVYNIITLKFLYS